MKKTILNRLRCENNITNNPESTTFKELINNVTSQITDRCGIESLKTGILKLKQNKTKRNKSFK